MSDKVNEDEREEEPDQIFDHLGDDDWDDLEPATDLINEFLEMLEEEDEENNGDSE